MQLELVFLTISLSSPNFLNLLGKVYFLKYIEHQIATLLKILNVFPLLFLKQL